MDHDAYLTYVVEGFIFVAIGSGTLAWLVCFIRHYIYRWFLLLLIPIILIYISSCIPIWNRGYADAEDGWLVIFYPITLILGYISLAFVVVIHGLIYPKSKDSMKGIEDREKKE